jgi:hypothetical protein
MSFSRAMDGSDAMKGSIDCGGDGERGVHWEAPEAVKSLEERGRPR